MISNDWNELAVRIEVVVEGEECVIEYIRRYLRTVDHTDMSVKMRKELMLVGCDLVHRGCLHIMLVAHTSRDGAFSCM